MLDLSMESSVSIVDMDVVKIGWKAEPNEGLSLKPTDGLNTVDEGDKWSVSPDFKHTWIMKNSFFLILYYECNREIMR